MRELTVVRGLAADPEQVWRAWTEPQEWAAWLWPERFGTEVRLDLTDNGHYQVSSQSMGICVSGHYRQVIHPSVLEFTWSWDGESEQTVVVVTLAPADDGTRLTLRHSGFGSDEARDLHVQGWSDCLDRLPAHLHRPTG